MRYGLELYTAPAAEPVSLTEAKLHLRVTSTDEDTLITSLISAARQWIEEQTYRQLVTATWDLVLDDFPSGRDPIRIPRAPLRTVTSISYKDGNGETQTVSTAVYAVSATRQPGEIRLKYGQVWPTAQDTPDAVTVRFNAGYGDADDVPDLLKAAVKLLVGQWYEYREPVLTASVNEVPLTVQRIVQTYDLGDELLEYGV